MAFYFPEAFIEIDWSQEQVFLDQELLAVDGFQNPRKTAA
jgi:hypothetical protein